MGYKAEVKSYKNEALISFDEHLKQLEQNVIKASSNEDNKKPLSSIYVEYQESTLKLIESKIKIDNEYLKQINIKYLEQYKDIEPEKFQELQEKLVSNHKQIIGEIKEHYETVASESREQLKVELAKTRDDGDLRVKSSNPESFFPDKLGTINTNFIIIFILLLAVIGLIYYYYFG